MFNSEEDGQGVDPVVVQSPNDMVFCLEKLFM